MGGGSAERQMKTAELPRGSRQQDGEQHSDDWSRAFRQGHFHPHPFCLDAWPRLGHHEYLELRKKYMMPRETHGRREGWKES